MPWMQNQDSKRILVLCKRQYTGKDLIDDRFGRLWELPRELAVLGHTVVVVVLSYRKMNEGLMYPPVKIGKGQIEWHSVNLGRTIIPGIIRYNSILKDIRSKYQTDIILAMSDAFHALIGKWYSRIYGARLIVDLYDNYESFKATRIPSVTTLFRKVVREADLVICVSDELEKFVRKKYGRKKKNIVIGNAARKDLFKPMDKSECRMKLGLPAKRILVGTAGALNELRDINTLFSAADHLVQSGKEVDIVVAGPRNSSVQWPQFARVHDLGVLPHAQVPILLNALDVAVVCNKETEFGKYCFPQKMSEIAACEVPFVAAKVGVTKSILNNRDNCLYTPGDEKELAEKIENMLSGAQQCSIELAGWDSLAGNLNNELMRLEMSAK